MMSGISENITIWDYGYLEQSMEGNLRPMRTSILLLPIYDVISRDEAVA